jgi:FMN phosphatase YigB (HAD superfamily)
MLVATGVDKLADELVLSCEVLSAKPSPGIYQHALRVLGVPAEAAVFVDDQARFCAGSVAVGIRAAQIVRGEPDGQRPAEGITLVRSLSEVEAMFEEQS